MKTQTMQTVATRLVHAIPTTTRITLEHPPYWDGMAAYAVVAVPVHDSEDRYIIGGPYYRATAREAWHLAQRLGRIARRAELLAAGGTLTYRHVYEPHAIN